MEFLQHGSSGGERLLHFAQVSLVAQVLGPMGSLQRAPNSAECCALPCRAASDALVLGSM